MSVIAPGSTIGILGSGQLGRMLAIAAAQLGYRTHVFAPKTGPACDVAARFTKAAYDDVGALAAFASEIDIATFEFENVPVAALGVLENTVAVRPNARALEVSQDRIAEKRFAQSLGLPLASFEPVAGAADIAAMFDRLGGTAILKSARMGYDGKGQTVITSRDEADQAWATIGGKAGVLESFVAFDAEFSVILVRGSDGVVRFWDSAENDHAGGILNRCSVPASPRVAAQVGQARNYARLLAEALDYVGVMACEFFACPKGAVFNEMAPRVHNSGHWTIEGAVTSQFENHIRAICGLPLGDTALTGHRVTMDNLIGGDARGWSKLLKKKGARVHLYGKGDERPGRKMGHVTRVEYASP